MKVGYKKLVDLYYSALMLFLVFTFADHLLQGLIHYPCVDLILYTLMWLFTVLQTTFAYIHIMKIAYKDYSFFAFLSDAFDICVAIYICAAISSTCNGNSYEELSSYCHLTIPFILLSFTQFLWFVKVKEYNIPAIFRICLLFLGMVTITVFECIYHSFWSLVFIVALIILLGILNCIDRSPSFFNKIAKQLWEISLKIDNILYRFLSINKKRK